MRERDKDQKGTVVMASHARGPATSAKLLPEEIEARKAFWAHQVPRKPQTAFERRMQSAGY